MVRDKQCKRVEMKSSQMEDKQSRKRFPWQISHQPDLPCKPIESVAATVAAEVTVVDISAIKTVGY